METMQHWTTKAHQTASCNPNTSLPTGNVQQNMLITKAYAELYLEKPKVFKWTGMAAFASDMVGAGILAGKTVDIAGDAFKRSTEFIDQLFKKKPTTPQERRRNITDLDNMLIAGNKAVFRDIYWQHLVYRDAGIDELNRLISSSGLTQKQMLIDGWSKIAAGDKTGASGLVWEGNALLLKYEQSVTLQKVYDAHGNLAADLSYFMVSPLPWQIARFDKSFPSGSVGDLQKRWKWIEGELLPHWKALDASSMTAYMRLFLMANTPKWDICGF